MAHWFSNLDDTHQTIPPARAEPVTTLAGVLALAQTPPPAITDPLELLKSEHDALVIEIEDLRVRMEQAKKRFEDYLAKEDARKLRRAAKRKRRHE